MHKKLTSLNTFVIFAFLLCIIAPTFSMNPKLATKISLPSRIVVTLHTAVVARNIPDIKKFLNCNANVNRACPQFDGATPLFLAAQLGFDDVITLLLEKEANIERGRPAEKLTPLHAAVVNDHESTTKLLLQKGANINAKTIEGNSVLHECAHHEKISMLRLLLLFSPNINIQDIQHATPLVMATFFGKKEAVQILLENNADGSIPMQDGITATFCAAQKGYIEILRLLLEQPNVVQSINTKRIKDNASALHMAIQGGHAEAALLLINNGADVNALADDFTPLYIATQKNLISVVNALLAKGADTEKTGDHGITPICVALKNEYIEIFLKLLEHGAILKKF